MPTKPDIHLYVAQPIKDRVVKMAARQNRSITKQAEVLLARGLDVMEKEEKRLKA